GFYFDTVGIPKHWMWWCPKRDVKVYQHGVKLPVTWPATKHRFDDCRYFDAPEDHDVFAQVDADPYEPLTIRYAGGPVELILPPVPLPPTSSTSTSTTTSTSTSVTSTTSTSTSSTSTSSTTSTSTSVTSTTGISTTSSSSTTSTSSPPPDRPR